MRDSSGILAIFGVIFLLVAAWFLYSGLQMDVTVANPLRTPELPALARVANAQLMQVQLSDILMGVGAAIISAILFAAGAIVAAVCSPAIVV
jgi:hypothetical protein